MQQYSEPRFAELHAFTAVAERSSFARAAVQLGVDPTIVSRRVGALEARLGVRLVERTTRSVSLTEAGRAYLHKARNILQALDDADQEAAGYATGAPRGHLRLALPSSFGRLWLAPMISEFLLAHPDITIEAEFTNRFVDLLGERFDLSVRLAELADSRLVARKIANRQRLLCASPDYLKRAPALKHPSDLSRHPCLLLSSLKTPRIWRLRNSKGGESVSVDVNGRLVSDDAEMLVQAAKSGLGVMQGTDWLLAQAIAAGSLVPVLPRWRVIDSGAIYVVTPSGAGQATKTRAFSDWLAERFKRPPWAEVIRGAPR
ncbi:MAG: LysR family transcriptional regulator [Proteobacteria bacterium]|nr:LysR family transcriptional regulator [Pseudomonadota bacterium]